ncbi:uncharacterized protein DNG_03126 [Cephalotrichum gorgonifer]|uniref:PKD domain-containing protein n=1 Tax=Cephalotrichum gorgonifer TaxID=2041049 RepID=A0AAE8MTN4_9PEZI|nr:uncharacterized protein DNG_03126 [Cephalotrichum gorgonifer]
MAKTARRLWPYACTASAVLAHVSVSVSTPLVATGPECVAVTVGGPLQITPDCTDPALATAIVDQETDEVDPVPHRKVSVHFDGTAIDFNIYLPKDGWDGRFFQLAYPLQNSTATSREIGFGAESGGYTVRVAGGGGHRADAAAAKLSRTIARNYYKSSGRDIYGYIYGGSGGSLVVVGAIENTFDVWQGAVPLVQAVPISNPNNFCVRAFAGLVLDEVADKIIDAVRPGGSGDPFKGLDKMRREALQEITELGIPLKALEDFDGVGRDRTSLWKSLRTMIVPIVTDLDPTYVEDFWSKSGYLGTEKSSLGTFFRKSVYEHDLAIKDIEVGADNVPVSLTFDKIPSRPPPHGLRFTLKSNDNERALGFFTADIDVVSKTAQIHSENNNATVLGLLSKGTKLHIDNRATLAVSAYHRYQVPTRAGFYGYGYLRLANGQPKYPQRSFLIAPALIQGASGGGGHTGNITAKVIVMDNLKDYDAFPWHADWYKNEVRTALGDRFADNFRLHYSENADHFMEYTEKPHTTRLIDFTGLWEQHLRDLSAWAEKGVLPPDPTNYTVSHGQVEVPSSASQRLGIQPVVSLTAQGKTRTTIKKGQSITFNAHIEVPHKAGTITSVAWDFDGTGEFVKKDFGKATQATNDVEVTQTYQKSGTYYPSVRIAVHRDGNAASPYAQVLNLGRMRVIVK